MISCGPPCFRVLLGSYWPIILLHLVMPCAWMRVVFKSREWRLSLSWHMREGWQLMLSECVCLYALHWMMCHLMLLMRRHLVGGACCGASSSEDS